ncbi:MAG: 2-isopropylmalate synthase [Candidatus Aureabacteria bacterium]|nr:2-isopropylmalate synthase [Candidatus Auribacterota bacterium]
MKRNGNEKVIVYDTTLRDGEQSPGASMNIKEKLEVAKQLLRLNVDAIEAGFPIASPGDFEAVKLISSEIKGPVISGLARSLSKDIDAAYEALKKAKRKRIHVFLATSKIHMKYKLKKAGEEILSQAVDAVRYAKKMCDDIEFSPEDASRTEPEFLARVVEAVIKAGATTVNIPDTVGYAIPMEFGSLIKYLFAHVESIDKAVVSVHCHNDLGLAVANSLEAVVNGARQVECTINGIGERAGNCSLEEIVMGIKTRGDIFKCRTGVNTTEIMKASRLITRVTGIVVQPNKAIVGENAFAHEAGIHQDGVLKERKTYEIMSPHDVGVDKSKLVLGKHSGRHAFKERVKELGFDLGDSDVEKAFERFKILCDKKKAVYDDDLVAIVNDEIAEVREVFKLHTLDISYKTGSIPEVNVILDKEKRKISRRSSGDGPVDAIYKAIDKITKINGLLLDYNIRSVTSGKDAIGEVLVRVDFGKGRIINGRGASTDVVEASAKAYLNAVNKLISSRVSVKTGRLI